MLSALAARVRDAGIRRQLIALFVLLVCAAALVLALVEHSQLRSRDTLQALRDQAIDRMRHNDAVSEAYAVDVVDTAFRVRSGQMDWDEGVATIDAARARIDAHWDALLRIERGPEHERAFDRVAAARRGADAAIARLRAILVARDADALSDFADRALYPAIDPVTSGLRVLSVHALLKADRLVATDLAWQARQRGLRITVTVGILLLVALLGQRVVRNVYLGIETLHWEARRLRDRDGGGFMRPRFRPRGELGEVLETFERMRADVRAYQSRLEAQLASNEAIRQDLVAREVFLRSLLDAAQVAIMAIDGNGRWTVFNPAAEQLLGWRSEEVVGRQARYGNVAGEDAPALVSPEQVENTVARLRQKLGRHVPEDWRALYALADLRRPPAETTLLHRNGRLVPVLLALSAIDDPDHGRTGVIAVAADMTQTRRLEAELRDSEARANAANAAKSAFLAAMSHEIRTPMIGVTGMLDVLAHSPLDDEQRRALNVIQQSAQSLLQVVGDILDFSKIEAGRLDLVAVPTDLARLLRNAVASFGGAAAAKGLELRCTVDARAAPAHLADPQRLRQVIANGLSNAVKFTPSGRIEAALEFLGTDGAGAEALCFRISDTGIGIEPSRQARLFQPFTQAEEDTSRHYGGTGLGLAISRHLAELMGGRLELESAPGQGTTLRLHVTLARADPATVEPEATRPGGPPPLHARDAPTLEEARADGTLVLLVDDHPTNRQVIARQLRLAGFAAETATDGAEALDRWRGGGHGLVLTDVHMPRMDGYALARAIRGEEAASGRPRTPIVALTAAALKEEADRCLAAGMDDYLAKPVPVATLAACLQRWLPQAAPVLDAAVLAELAAGDDGTQLLQEFLEATTADLAALDAARAAGDAPGVAREAHRMKGAARLVGAVDVAARAGAVEAAARSGDPEALAALSARLADAMARLRTRVEAAATMPGEMTPRDPS